MTTKPCIKCLKEKPLEAFHKHPQMADGHLNKCKECVREYVRQHRKDNSEKVRAYDNERASLPHRVAMRASVVAAYKIDHPKRVKATTAVYVALRDGKLFRQPCWVCGKKAVAHHPDYDRPLDVVWLCQAHHKQAHALIASRATAAVASCRVTAETA